MDDARPARVTIEERTLGERPWAVIISRPGRFIPRTLWERYRTQQEAQAGVAAARAYLADAERGVEA